MTNPADDTQVELPSIEQLLREEAAKLGILAGEDTKESDTIDDPAQIEAESGEALTNPTELDIFDSLLDESMYAYQANIKMRKGQRLTKCEKTVLESQDVERNWLPLGLVALTLVEECTCGKANHTFTGWYAILQHRSDSTVKRISKVDGVFEPFNIITAPLVQHTVHKQVTLCGACLVDLLDLPSATTEQVAAWGLQVLK